jgi:hypothetical protein
MKEITVDYEVLEKQIKLLVFHLPPSEVKP